MFFGFKFYDRLHKLSPWQQSLFAFALACRQEPNLELVCALYEADDVSHHYAEALRLVETFHQDKFNHLDLEELADQLEGLLPELNASLSIGELFLQDALLTLQCACEAVFLHEGSEAEQASNLSMGGVLRRLEAQSDEQISEEEAHDHPLVEAELEFQLTVLKLIEHGKERAVVVKKVQQLLTASRESNIGIGRED